MALHTFFALAGSFCCGGAIAGLLVLLVREIRTAPVLDDEPVPYVPAEAPCDELPEIKVISDRPVDETDLAALHAVAVFLYGPQLGELAYGRMVDSIAADESRDIDTVIERLGGGF